MKRLIPMREQIYPSNAFDTIWDKLMGNQLGLLTQFVSFSKNRKRITQEDKLLALSINGHVLVFRPSKSTVTKHMDWLDFSNETHGKAIVKRIERNVELILDD